jgi:hypothetical protein
MCDALFRISVLRGVGHSPNPIPAVRRCDGTSWNNKRPACVAFGFQVSQHIVEAHADVASNVLSNDPSGPEFVHEPTKFWPEVAVIFLALSLPGCGKWLAWVSAANNINWSNVRAFQFANVSVDWYIGPMMLQHPARKRFNLTESHGFKSARPFKAETETADTRKQVQDFERHGATCGKATISQLSQLSGPAIANTSAMPMNTSRRDSSKSERIMPQPQHRPNRQCQLRLRPSGQLSPKERPCQIC